MLDRKFEIQAFATVAVMHDAAQAVLPGAGLLNYTLTAGTVETPDGTKDTTTVSYILGGEPAFNEAALAQTAAAKLAAALDIDAVFLSVTPISCALINQKGKNILGVNPEEEELAPQIIVGAPEAAGNTA